MQSQSRIENHSKTQVITQLGKATIFSDHQGALNALRVPADTSRQSVLIKILQVWDDITGLECRSQMDSSTSRYTRQRYCGRGSEAGDHRAARPHTTPKQKTPLTTAKKKINTYIHQDWDYVWSHAKH